MTRLPPPIGDVEILEVFEEYEEPLLYTACNERGETFLAVLAKDTSAEQVWHFACVSPRRLRDLRAGAVDLRDAFLLVEGGWLTALHRAKEPGVAAWAEPILASTLVDALLPEVNERLDVVDADLVVPDVRAIATAERRDVVTLRMVPRVRSRREVSVGPLSQILNGFQGCTYAIGDSQAREALLKAGKNRPPRRKKDDPPPVDRRELLRLTAAAIFDGSFGIELHAAELGNLFSDTAASVALEKLLDLLGSAGDEVALIKQLETLRGGPTAAKFKTLLMGVSQDITQLHVDWAGPKAGRAKRVVVSQEQAGAGVRTIMKMRPDEPEEYWLEGVFDELGYGPKTFQFIDDGPEARTIRGRIDDVALESVRGVPIRDGRYEVRIRETRETNVEGEVLYKFRLMEVRGSLEVLDVLALMTADAVKAKESKE